MKKKFGIIVILLISGWQGKAQKNSDYFLKEEFIETENRIKLATDVYLPQESGKYPVILVRTPYLKNNFKGGAEKFIQQGYAVVVQDCRGKFKSEGEFYAFKNERVDGLKTIAWIKTQPWYNGKIAGYGGSYGGYTQWAISDQLDAVTAELTGANLYDLVYPNGLFSLETIFNWGLVVDAKLVNNIPPEKLMKSYWFLPLSVADDSTVKDSRFINDWLLHENNDDYWGKLNHQGMSKGPVLSIGGWYDIFLLTQINDFVKIDKKNGLADNHLIIGPWCHGPQGFKNEYGGSNSTGKRGPLQERFLAKNILGKEEKVLEPPFTDHKYNFFIMEKNEYFGSETWPPKEVNKKTYYLEKGKISSVKSNKAEESEFLYDPKDPYPSLGGTALGMGVGPAVQNANLTRRDQVVFETEELAHPLTLLGNVSASLYVKSTAKKTDFMILLQDVFPNDTIINIQEGGKSFVMAPNKVNKIELECWPTGYQLKPGHKLRMVITSSWFPRYNRSLNGGAPISSATELKETTQILYFGKKYPSQIILPLLNLD